MRNKVNTITVGRNEIYLNASTLSPKQIMHCEKDLSNWEYV